MKRIKSVNGYTIYEATSARDEANYNCGIGHYNLYLSSDIKDFGLSNSYPDWEDIETMSEAVARANGSQFAVATAMAWELSDSTIEDVALRDEIERRLEAGQSMDYIRDHYDTENGCFVPNWMDTVVAQYIADKALPDYADDEDDYEADPQYYCLTHDEPSFPAEEESIDVSTLHGEPEDEAALRDWELSAVEPGDFFGDKLGYARVVTVWRDSNGELQFLTVGPGGESKIIDAATAHKLEVVTDQSDESVQWGVVDYWAEATAIHHEQERSHASYIVIRDEDGKYSTKSFPRREEWDEETARRVLFHWAAEQYAFNDCGGADIVEIVVDGVHAAYDGWKPGMRFVFRDTATKLPVYDACYPHWDH